MVNTNAASIGVFPLSNEEGMTHSGTAMVVTNILLSAMVKAAIVLLADVDTDEGVGRMVNSLETAKKFAENPEDDLELVFDGTGTRWIPELENEDHDFHDLYAAVEGDASACTFCSDAFGVADAVGESNVPLVDEYDGHLSIEKLVKEGYEVLTF